MIDPYGGHSFKAYSTWATSNMHNLINVGMIQSNGFMLLQQNFIKSSSNTSSRLRMSIESPPNAIDWEHVQTFLKFLKIFYEATKYFSTSLHVSIDNVNFYHYPSYISLAKSSLPKLLTYLILNFTLLL